ncbi:MAG: hypothetical protein ACRD0F_10040, partial [Acidimicrobiales bacterium]
AQAAVESGWRAPDVDTRDVGAIDLEAWLLARLVAHRSGLAGPVPLVIDDAFAGLSLATATRARAVLARGLVQVIIVSDDPDAATWARSLGPDRAAVCRVELSQ